jgi:hypothetical protein
MPLRCSASLFLQLLRPWHWPWWHPKKLSGAKQEGQLPGLLLLLVLPLPSPPLVMFQQLLLGKSPSGSGFYKIKSFAFSKPVAEAQHPACGLAWELARPQPCRDSLGVDEEEDAGPQLHQLAAVETGHPEGVG